MLSPRFIPGDYLVFTSTENELIFIRILSYKQYPKPQYRIRVDNKEPFMIPVETLDKYLARPATSTEVILYF